MNDHWRRIPHFHQPMSQAEADELTDEQLNWEAIYMLGVKHGLSDARDASSRRRRQLARAADERYALLDRTAEARSRSRTQAALARSADVLSRLRESEKG